MVRPTAKSAYHYYFSFPMLRTASG
jgi:hypothetical protein